MVERKWTTSFSRDKDKIYKQAGLRWLVYTSAGGCNPRSQKYIKSTVSTSSMLFLANQLASICPSNSQYAKEICIYWESFELDDDPLLYNPTTGPFTLVQDAFVASVKSRQILLGHYVLPSDNCQLIVTLISTRTAIAVCNESYDPRDNLGMVAFVMLANKQDKHPLTAANWSQGTSTGNQPIRLSSLV